MAITHADGFVKAEKVVPCGLYRTTEPIADKISSGMLVYYHNHGNPGPGVYQVEKWRNNKAVFAKTGVVIPADGYEHSLFPLKPEAFYRVVEPFYCCENHCRLFEKNTLVQLGYNGKGDALLFVPEWSYNGIHLPEKGTRVDDSKLAKMEILKVVADFKSDQEEQFDEYLTGFPGSDLTH